MTLPRQRCKCGHPAATHLVHDPFGMALRGCACSGMFFGKTGGMVCDGDGICEGYSPEA